MKFTSQSLSIINFNTMGLFNFDTFNGFFSSLNLRERQKKIVEILAAQNADIITLQEVHTYSFLKILKKKLKSYPYVAYEHLLFGPRGALVVFSKLPLEQIKYINFQDRGTIFNSSIVSKIRRSGILVCKIKDKDIYILNMHLTHNGDFKWTSNNRFYSFIKSQLTQIAKVVNDIGSANSKIIVTGDFNTDKKSLLYKNFIRDSRLLDVFDHHSLPTMHQEFLPKRKLAKTIDYVFLRSARSKQEIKSTNYLFTKKYLIKNGKQRYLSDHIGLFTNFLFKSL